MLVQSGREQFVAGVGALQRVSLRWAANGVAAHGDGGNLKGRQVTFTGRGGEAEFYLSVPGRLRRRYRGNLAVVADTKELVPVVDVELETAVTSIVAAELPADAPLETLKAQAVVSRSYLVSGGTRHRYSEFCDSTHCQFFREPPAADSPASRAARATAGMVLEWKGRPFAAMFSASCGGHTHSLEQIGYAATDYPYFPVECPYCRHAPERWQSRLSEKDASALAANSESARVKTGRRLGWHAVESNTYTATRTSSGVELSGTGRGHGVGLCQRGAVEMARAGRDFRAILTHYFPNAMVR